MSGEELSKMAEYESEPVFYCKSCLSLDIRNNNDEEIPCYCNKCGSADIDEVPHDEWKYIYKLRYKKDFK